MIETDRFLPVVSNRMGLSSILGDGVGTGIIDM